MKDMCHHLKHIQKKVLQSVRKEENQSKPLEYSSEIKTIEKEEPILTSEKRADSNHRVPRLGVRSTVH